MKINNMHMNYYVIKEFAIKSSYNLFAKTKQSGNLTLSCMQKLKNLVDIWH